MVSTGLLIPRFRLEDDSWPLKTSVTKINAEFVNDARSEAESLINSVEMGENIVELEYSLVA